MEERETFKHWKAIELARTAVNRIKSYRRQPLDGENAFHADNARIALREFLRLARLHPDLAAYAGQALIADISGYLSEA